MKKILIVDDEKMMLKLAERILSKEYTTVSALSGEEAVALFEREKPDMVLSDLRMPGMSGYELQRIIQEMSGSSVPFIFMTADESDESENRGFQEGAADYIRKPLKAELLLRRLERIFQNVEKVHGLQEAAEHDAMTGLLNKAASKEKISALCREARGMLLVLDLDSFKLVNDIYGHKMGDQVLICFSSLLKSVLRKGDVAGRIGGDEFIAFCRSLKDESALEEKTKYLNEELIKSAKELMGADMSIPLGTSVGAVRASGDGADYEELFQKADNALYSVKQAGKHGYMLYRGLEDIGRDKEYGGLANIRLILGERNISPGAWVVDRESFQIIYRFLVRFGRSCPCVTRFVLFTLKADASFPKGRAAEHFLEVARTRLRSSDILCRFGEDQLVALLMDVDDKSVVHLVDRVLLEWANDGGKPSDVKWESQGLTRE